MKTASLSSVMQTGKMKRQGTTDSLQTLLMILELGKSGVQRAACPGHTSSWARHGTCWFTGWLACCSARETVPATSCTAQRKHVSLTPSAPALRVAHVTVDAIHEPQKVAAPDLSPCVCRALLCDGSEPNREPRPAAGRVVQGSTGTSAG